MSQKLFEIERREDEGAIAMHIRVPIPRPPSLLPSATQDHLRGALRETLLAQRSILNALIERAETGRAPNR